MLAEDKCWYTLQGLKGGDTPDSFITFIAANSTRVMVGDRSGQLILFKHDESKEGELHFDCEIIGFDFFFDVSIAQEVHRAVMCIDWLSEDRFVACNEKEIKVFSC